MTARAGKNQQAGPRYAIAADNTCQQGTLQLNGVEIQARSERGSAMDVHLGAELPKSTRSGPCKSDRSSAVRFVRGGDGRRDLVLNIQDICDRRSATIAYSRRRVDQ